MQKTYEVKVDVTMSGWFYVEAESAEEAARKVKAMSVTASDLRNFYHLDTEVVDDPTECED